MEKEIKKILYKVLPFVLCLCIVSGATAPAYAAPTTIDQWAQYDGSGWSYNSSSGTFSWNTNMANSSEFVILSYLRDLYSSVKTYNDNLKSGWLFTSNGYSYPSGWSGSFYKVVLDMINSVNTSLNNNFYSNLQSYSSYPLYTYKAFTDSNLYSQQSFSSGNFILNFFSGIASLNNNVAYIANQLYADNASGSYNARSLLNKALHKYVDSSQADYTTILNSINTDTANLSGIKTDTANLSGIKTDTANLSGIKTDTSNLSAILTGVNDFKIANHTDVTSVKTSLDNFKTVNHTDITAFQNDFNNLAWNNYGTGKAYDSNFNEVSNGQNVKYFGYPLIGGVGIYKFHIPISNYWNNLDYKINGVYIKQPNSTNLLSISSNVLLYIVNGGYVGVDIYVIGMPVFFGQSISSNELIIDINYESYYYGSGLQASLLPQANQDYWLVYNALVNYKSLEDLDKLTFMFADDKTIAAKKSNQAQEDSVLSNFTGSGAASASVSDFGAVKDSIVDLKAGFNGGASSSDTFSFLSGDSNAWDWFTQDTANDLDRTQGSNTRLLRSSSSVASDTPLLDSYYTSILSILGGDN